MRHPPAGRRLSDAGDTPPPALLLPRLSWRKAGPDSVASSGERMVAEECAVALSFNRLSHAVMMATPSDLADFALGFSLNEGILSSRAELEECEIVVAPDDGGIELRLWIDNSRMGMLEKRRRRMAGPTGCGMCGLESLSDAVRPPPPVGAGQRFDAAEIAAAAASLGPAQSLNHATRAVHAAGFWTREAGLVAVREDVGRHNALDKLAGALATSGQAAASGVVVMTSRLSVELVQKAAAMGAPVLVAVSAPTALAVRVATRAGMTLVGIARQDGFEVFCGGQRVVV